MAVKAPRLGDIAEVANAIQLAAAPGGKGLGRTVLFIGAGASKSAGIPLVPDMAQQLVIKLATAKRAPADVLKSAEAAYGWLSAGRGIPDCRIGEAPKDGGRDNRAIDWSRVYDMLFSDHYKTPDHAREIFSEFVNRAEGKINWAHLCLGELVKQKLVSTVITTNSTNWHWLALFAPGCSRSSATVLNRSREFAGVTSPAIDRVARLAPHISLTQLSARTGRTTRQRSDNCRDRIPVPGASRIRCSRIRRA